MFTRLLVARLVLGHLKHEQHHISDGPFLKVRDVLWFRACGERFPPVVSRTRGGGRSARMLQYTMHDKQGANASTSAKHPTYLAVSSSSSAHSDKKHTKQTLPKPPDTSAGRDKDEQEGMTGGGQPPPN